MSRNRSSPLNTEYWKAASRIHSRLQTVESWPEKLKDIRHSWEAWKETLGRINIAHSRRWSGALKELRQEACGTLQELTGRIETARSAIGTSRRESLVLPVPDIYGDILALQREFPAVECDLRNGSLSAITEPIELEGVYLGDFEIRLNWSLPTGELDYFIVAREPNPSAKSEEVTHPHVDSEQLCAGDGRFAIKSALEQGRLLDFFLVVRQVLETYNSSSAYVEMHNWYGLSCPDCAAEVYDEDLVTCEDCETSVCGECSRYCCQCHINLCGECCSDCPQCDETTCRHCLTTCTKCQSSICKGCLNDDKLCPDCVEKQDNHKDQKTCANGTEVKANAGALVHTVCLGEAAVPA